MDPTPKETLASVSTKRKREISKKQLKSRKKQKGREVAALPWRELAVSSNLDDYEGFFGLEELSDVDVQKDASGGVVFKHKTSSKKDKPKKVSRKKALQTEDQPEWEGLEDDDPGDKHVQSDEVPAVKYQVFGDLEDDIRPIDGSGNQFEMLNDAGGLDEGADIQAWRKLQLSEDSLSALSRLGFDKPTPIQFASIAHILQGRDVIGKAPTGSGKTLAFGLPIIESVLLNTHKQGDQIDEGPSALIIEPTRELAHQIEAHLSALQLSRPLRIATLTGGLSVQKQKRLLKHADIIVATPGRLWDVMEGDQQLQEAIKRIDFLVIDEADRLLSQGHFKELEQILTSLDRHIKDKNTNESAEPVSKDKSRQTLVFSAIFAKELQQKLAKKAKLRGLGSDPNSMAYLLQKLNFRQQPLFVDVNPKAKMPENLTEAMIEVSDSNKDLHLYAVLLLYQPNSMTRSLVFVNSISAVRRLVPFLSYLGFNAFPLHSGMEQKARLRSVEQFKSPKTGSSQANASSTRKSSVLIATDVAARGLDIPEVHVVVHYHVPRAADMYVHRSGRTARAAARGTSILMSASSEASGVKRLVTQVHDLLVDSTKKNQLQMLSLDDRIVNQLRPRALLAKKIADAEQAREKSSSSDKILKQAAEDMGVDIDGETVELNKDRGRGGRGKKRKEKEADARAISKAELQRTRAELRGMLQERINTGVSQKYLANGNVDMAALLAEHETANGAGGFLGHVKGLHLQL